ncbi:MAG: hypothetical protein Q8O67_26770 [Deltaproteobacteria bacterium]|nr:hypothetical protein [Deltaproteobacteria bacterium]
MTGLEILVMLAGGVVSFVSAIVVWVFTSERLKAQLVEALGREYHVLAERNGNVDRPIGLTLRGRGCDVDVDAVVRGDNPLWHLKITRPQSERDQVFVVVDVDWTEAVREVRGLLFIEQLTPRFAIWASDVDAASARLDRLHGREDLCFVLLEPAAARCLVHRQAAGVATIFLELPREGLCADDVEAALLRLEDARCVLVGRPVDRARSSCRGVGSAASGMPFAVPSPRLV